MTDYDVRSIFEQMELELIASMKRNLSRHQKWEKDEKINWTMWQAEQLRTFENFKKENEKIFGARFTSINNAIADFLKENASTAGFEQERLILEQLAKGNKVNHKIEESLSGAFFSLNKDKMNALINATVNDMKKAEHAMLRMVNDQYRKTIFRAQVMANSGAFTLKQSIDAATKDFLKAGINCIEYKDGRRVNIATYAEMAVRTANKRAVLQSEGEARDAYGVHTVRISKYGGCSETCLPWQGRIYVDDIWSGGTKEEANEKKLPLLSEAVEGGLFHPNCKHRATTYFYDLEKALEDQDEEGLENPLEEQEHRKNHLHIQQQERLETGSLDPKNISEAKQRKELWIEKDTPVEKQIKIKRNYGRDLAQYERYKQVLDSSDIPKTFEDFRELKYNDIESWDSLKKLYSASKQGRILQNHHDYIWNTETGFLPKGVKLENINIIAGKGSKTKLRVAEQLVDEFGGEPSEWQKKVAKITSEKYIFDVHWYELDNKQYNIKVKYRKDLIK